MPSKTCCFVCVGISFLHLIYLLDLCLIMNDQRQSNIIVGITFFINTCCFLLKKKNNIVDGKGLTSILTLISWVLLMLNFLTVLNEIHSLMLTCIEFGIPKFKNLEIYFFEKSLHQRNSLRVVSVLTPY